MFTIPLPTKNSISSKVNKGIKIPSPTVIRSQQSFQNEYKLSLKKEKKNAFSESENKMKV